MVTHLSSRKAFSSSLLLLKTVIPHGARRIGRGVLAKAYEEVVAVWSTPKVVTSGLQYACCQREYHPERKMEVPVRSG
jgi:hypothetical protein